LQTRASVNEKEGGAKRRPHSLSNTTTHVIPSVVEESRAKWEIIKGRIFILPLFFRWHDFLKSQNFVKMLVG